MTSSTASSRSNAPSSHTAAGSANGAGSGFPAGEHHPGPRVGVQHPSQHGEHPRRRVPTRRVPPRPHPRRRDRRGRRGRPVGEQGFAVVDQHDRGLIAAAPAPPAARPGRGRGGGRRCSYRRVVGGRWCPAPRPGRGSAPPARTPPARRGGCAPASAPAPPPGWSCPAHRYPGRPPTGGCAGGVPGRAGPGCGPGTRCAGGSGSAPRLSLPTALGELLDRLRRERRDQLGVALLLVEHRHEPVLQPQLPGAGDAPAAIGSPNSARCPASIAVPTRAPVARSA